VIERFVAQSNDRPKPFVWTADPDKIIATVRRAWARFFVAALDTKIDTRPDTKPREFNLRNARIQ
jgi:hypothetical protein